jgi:hypothetical protein
MASVVEICNRALQKLGAKRITAISEDSVNARACNTAYDPLRRAELRAHPWSCAVARVQLAASSTDPVFVKQNSFPLPSDYVRLLPNDEGYNYNSLDWQIEAGNIITDDSAPLNVRYIYDLTDPNLMDALFREALSARMALEMCEEITQSNQKKESLRQDYKDAIREARRVNAILKIAEKPPEDEWITVRG